MSISTTRQEECGSNESGQTYLFLLLGVVVIVVLAVIVMDRTGGHRTSDDVIQGGFEEIGEDPSGVPLDGSEAAGSTRTDTSICTIEKKSIESAQEMFLVLNGRYASDMDELVLEGNLGEPSEFYETEGTVDDFAVIPLPQGPCDTEG